MLFRSLEEIVTDTRTYKFGTTDLNFTLCALASDKKILVYDEPTSGLDYTRMLDVAEAIKSMQKRGRTQFVITHDPELIEKCCDYVMFMDKGGVIDVGTIEEERLHRIKKFFRV